MAVGKYREPGLKVFGNDYPTPDGTCVRDYIHILDLAEGHLNAMVALDDDSKFVNQQKDGKYRAFNLGKGVGMSVLNMIEAMRKVTGYDYPYEIVGRRPGDVPDLTADPTLAEKELGFKATRSLDDMVRTRAGAADPSRATCGTGRRTTRTDTTRSLPSLVLIRLSPCRRMPRTPRPVRQRPKGGQRRVGARQGRALLARLRRLRRTAHRAQVPHRARGRKARTAAARWRMVRWRGRTPGVLLRFQVRHVPRRTRHAR